MGILPAERRILRRGLWNGGQNFVFASTPKPAGETPTLPEIVARERLHLDLTAFESAGPASRVPAGGAL